MKLSVSMSEDDVSTLDSYARSAGLESRSAVLRRAIQLLRESELEAEYAVAWKEWKESGDADLWETVVGDGLDQ